MSAGNLLIQSRRIPSDQLTPVLAYRRLVAPDDRNAPSFLFESVEQGGSVGRYSMLGARPVQEVVATGHSVEIFRDGALEKRFDCPDPLQVPREISARWKPYSTGGVPGAFHGGWVGFLSFDAVRWLEPKALSFHNAPKDDRKLPDMHMGLYREVVVFDHFKRTLDCVVAQSLDEHGSESAAKTACETALERLKSDLFHQRPALPTGDINLNLGSPPKPPKRSSMSRAEFEGAVLQAKNAIAAGDAFQIVLSQRLERETWIDPFELYRALRIVNPSPYQVYLQASGCILAASSPEILCRVRDGVVVNRPLAGTRARGATPELDAQMEAELLADHKERAEHVMLVDLGRNDLGRVCQAGSVQIDRCMDVERYSHVMHLSSTVSGTLEDRFNAWDALRATLPVGTVSGAPKIRAIQIIDQLEPVRRGPYAGGIGVIGFDGSMDMAISLRTMVMPTNREPNAPWKVHLQAGAGVVLDSDPTKEWQETMAKAAALGRAMDLAEDIFVEGNSPKNP